jgi:putative endonuclease
MVLGGTTYILTNRTRSTLYTGSTVDIQSRIEQHKGKFYPNAFSGRYNVYRMVFRRHFGHILEAREYEYYIKGKKRDWKIRLIESENPNWKDLSNEMKNW